MIVPQVSTKQRFHSRHHKSADFFSFKNPGVGFPKCAKDELLKRLEEKEVRNDHCSDHMSPLVTFPQSKMERDNGHQDAFVFTTENCDFPVSVLEGI